MASALRRLRRPRWLVVLVTIALVAAALGVLLGGSRDSPRPRGDQQATVPGAPLGAPAPSRARPAPRSTTTSPAPRASERIGPQIGFPRPESVPPGSAARGLARFMEAWRDLAWRRALNWTAPSWRQSYDDPAAALRTILGNRKLRGWTLLNDRLQATRGRVIVLVVERPRLGSRLQRRRLSIDVRKENDQARLDSGGVWGLVPSTIRQLATRRGTQR